LIFLSIEISTGRQLECSYSTFSLAFWSEFYQCSLSQVDLSKSFQSQIHSFSGSSSQKSEATTVLFDGSAQIDFIPKEILKEFPNLNGLIFSHCNLPVLKNELFSEEFSVLKYLDLKSSQILSIEPFAFEHLKNLKRLSLLWNKIQSLPIQIQLSNPRKPT
jgi:hypothetical protein